MLPTRLALAILPHDPRITRRRIQQQMILLLAISNPDCHHVAQVSAILVNRHAIRLPGIDRVDNVVRILATGRYATDGEREGSSIDVVARRLEFAVRGDSLEGRVEVIRIESECCRDERC